MKRITTAVIVVIFWLLSSCDFQNPSDFEIPTWNINLNIPLMDRSYALAEIVNDSTIRSAGDSIQVQFSGELPKDSIGPDYLKIPLDISITNSLSITPPNASSFFSGFTLPLTIPIPVGTFMDGTIINENTGELVVIPSNSDQVITGESWNIIASIVEAAIGDTSIIETIYDSQEVFGSLSFIQSVEGIIIGETSDDNFFLFRVVNEDLPLLIDSSFAFLNSSNDTLAFHGTSNVPADSTFADTASLVGKSLGEVIEIAFGFTLERVNDDTLITIPANSNVNAEITIGIGIANLQKAVVVIAEAPLAPDVDPVAFGDAGVSAEECKVIGVYGGEFFNGTDQGVNLIGISDVMSTFPFDIDFTMKFGNFVSPTNDTLSFNANLSRGNRPVTNIKKIDGWTFSNPNPDLPLDSIFIDVTAKTVADTVDIFLDGSEPAWSFDIGVEVSALHFSNLSADIDCPFPTQSQEIAGIPTGFTGMSFREVILEFTMFNQIRLPLFLDLDLKGVGKMGDTVTVILNAELENPDSPGDTAKTVLRLNKDGTKVDLYKIASSATPDSSYFLPKGETGTIVDLLALNPTEIIVDATAGIKGKGDIDVGAAIWGEYKLIAPFEVTMEPMTFIPNTSTPMDEMPHDTRSQMRNSLKGATMTTRIINGLPVGGELTILLSDKDLFPLDREDSTLAMVRDSLGWPGTDILYIVTSCSTLTPSNPNMYIFSVMTDSTDCVEDVAYLIRDAANSEVDTVISFVDTLFKVVLPSPAALYTLADSVFTPGMVKDKGDTTVVSGLDSNDVKLLTSLGEHFITSRIHFFGTDGNTVFFSMRDTLRALAYLTFTMVSTGLFEEVKDEIIITNPNGGETLTVGEDVIIRWRSLGNKVKSENIKVFTSLVQDPDVTNDGHWFAISGTVANVDSLVWTPDTPAEALWLRVCNEAGNLCDQSGWTFEVVSGTRILGVVNWGEEAMKFNELPNVHQHTVDEKLDNKFKKLRK
ncbi:MAG: hypothetical protein IIB44_05835 [Candidatus Marinimicrobia bacterium]|nr:hypothetical protein [Candidatus Neomarinimicrobiota bacterium]